MLRFTGIYSISNTRVHVLQWVIEKGRAMNRSSVSLVCHTMPQNEAAFRMKPQKLRPSITACSLGIKRIPPFLKGQRHKFCSIALPTVGQWTIHNNPTTAMGWLGFQFLKYRIIQGPSRPFTGSNLAPICLRR